MDTSVFTGVTADTRMLYWTPGEPTKIKLVPFPDPECDTDEHRSYQFSSLGCYSRVRDMSYSERTKFVFVLVANLIIRDGMDPQTVHETLLPLDEYRNGLIESETIF